jgi:hypothetical protein
VDDEKRRQQNYDCRSKEYVGAGIVEPVPQLGASHIRTQRERNAHGSENDREQQQEFHKARLMQAARHSVREATTPFVASAVDFRHPATVMEQTMCREEDGEVADVV